MTRTDLEHIIRAATSIANVYEIVIVGSQAVLGKYASAPSELLQSMEADVYPLDRPDLTDLIDGSIGELSPFNMTFGYYAQGVGTETAILPMGWQDRLVKIQNANTDLKIGWCLEPHDLAVSKLAAGRDKDWPYVRTLLNHQLIDENTLLARIEQTPRIPADRQAFLKRWVHSKKP